MAPDPTDMHMASATHETKMDMPASLAVSTAASGSSSCSFETLGHSGSSSTTCSSSSTSSSHSSSTPSPSASHSSPSPCSTSFLPSPFAGHSFVSSFHISPASTPHSLTRVSPSSSSSSSSSISTSSAASSGSAIPSYSPSLSPSLQCSPSSSVSASTSVHVSRTLLQAPLSTKPHLSILCSDDFASTSTMDVSRRYINSEQEYYRDRECADCPSSSFCHEHCTPSHPCANAASSSTYIVAMEAAKTDHATSTTTRALAVPRIPSYPAVSHAPFSHICHPSSTPSTSSLPAPSSSATLTSSRSVSVTVSSLPIADNTTLVSSSSSSSSSSFSSSSSCHTSSSYSSRRSTITKQPYTYILKHPLSSSYDHPDSHTRAQYGVASSVSHDTYEVYPSPCPTHSLTPVSFDYPIHQPHSDTRPISCVSPHSYPSYRYELVRLPSQTPSFSYPSTHHGTSQASLPHMSVSSTHSSYPECNTGRTFSTTNGGSSYYFAHNTNISAACSCPDCGRGFHMATPHVTYVYPLKDPTFSFFDGPIAKPKPDVRQSALIHTSSSLPAVRSSSASSVSSSSSAPLSSSSTPSSSASASCSNSFDPSSSSVSAPSCSSDAATTASSSSSYATVAITNTRCVRDGSMADVTRLAEASTQSQSSRTAGQSETTAHTHGECVRSVVERAAARAQSNEYVKIAIADEGAKQCESERQDTKAAKEGTHEVRARRPVFRRKRARVAMCVPTMSVVKQQVLERLARGTEKAIAKREKADTPSLVGESANSSEASVPANGTEAGDMKSKRRPSRPQQYFVRKQERERIKRAEIWSLFDALCPIVGLQPATVAQPAMIEHTLAVWRAQETQMAELSKDLDQVIRTLDRQRTVSRHTEHNMSTRDNRGMSATNQHSDMSVCFCESSYCGTFSPSSSSTSSVTFSAYSSSTTGSKLPPSSQVTSSSSATAFIASSPSLPSSATTSNHSAESSRKRAPFSSNQNIQPMLSRAALCMIQFPGYLTLVSLDGILLDACTYICDDLGLSRCEMIGRPLDDTMSAKSRADFTRHVADNIRQLSGPEKAVDWWRWSAETVRPNAQFAHAVGFAFVVRQGGADRPINAVLCVGFRKTEWCSVYPRDGVSKGKVMLS